MKINFVLPSPTLKIAGGYKMVYEYSNRLVLRGHEVTIIYDSRKGKNSKSIPAVLAYFSRLFIGNRGPSWFDLNKKVKKKVVFEINNKNIPCADVIIATAADTAFDVKNLDDSKGRKYYFIQDYENWNLTDHEVKTTYRLGMKNIVIAKWLKDIVDKESLAESSYIPNGIDFDVFNVTNSIEKRNSKSIAMLYHHDARKDAKKGLEIILAVKQQYPDLKVKLFGVPERPENLPSDIDYIQKANQKELKKLYNESAIFLCSSLVEGFGLTGAESMACGCALVSTDCQGVMEYAQHNLNALISPVGDYDLLYNNIVCLIENNNLRIQLALNGNRTIKDLSWDESVDKFERALRNN